MTKGVLETISANLGLLSVAISEGLGFAIKEGLRLLSGVWVSALVLQDVSSLVSCALWGFFVVEGSGLGFRGALGFRFGFGRSRWDMPREVAGVRFGH